MPFYFHSKVKCVNQFEMHRITSWTFISDHARPIALFDFPSVRMNAPSVLLLFSLYVMCAG